MLAPRAISRSACCQSLRGPRLRRYSVASIPSIPPAKSYLPPSEYGCPTDMAPPSRFGSYAVLNKVMAMETYPPPRDVPAQIKRPGYVPLNYFTAPIWEHEARTDEAREGTIALGTEEESGVRAAGRVAAAVLKRAGEVVKVSCVGSN